jgi:site-specific recombinase XerD
MTLEEYLNKFHRPRTVIEYKRDIGLFLENTPNPQNGTIKDILSYLEILRKKFDNPSTIKKVLVAVRKYYQYLVVINYRDDNPVDGVKLNDVKKKNRTEGLYDDEQLEQLKEQILAEETLYYKSLFSLLIFQALTITELQQVLKENIDLTKGAITIKATNLTLTRTLKLDPTQILIFYKLLETYTDDKLPLFNETHMAIQYHLKHRYKIENVKKIIPSKVRRSLVSKWVREGKDLREVQYLAGYKSILTAQAYTSLMDEKLKERIRMLHPLR